MPTHAHSFSVSGAFYIHLQGPHVAGLSLWVKIISLTMCCPLITLSVQDYSSEAGHHTSVGQLWAQGIRLSTSLHWWYTIYFFHFVPACYHTDYIHVISLLLLPLPLFQEILFSLWARMIIQNFGSAQMTLPWTCSCWHGSERCVCVCVVSFRDGG